MDGIIILGGKFVILFINRGGNMLKKEYYPTDFISEFFRWSKVYPSDLLIKASLKEQQAVLADLRRKSSLTLVFNKGKTIKTHTQKTIKTALKNKESKK